MVRETLVGLAQWNFDWVPPSVRDVVMPMFGGYCQMAINEHAHNVCRDRQRDVKHSCQPRLARYLWPHTTKVLEQFDRPEVVPDPKDRAGSRRLPEGAYNSMTGNPTIDDKVLQRIMDNQASWPTCSPQSFNLVPAAFQLLLSVHRRNAWGDLASAWHAVFLIPASIVRFVPDGSLWAVLDSNQYGLWLWPCQWRVVSGVEAVLPSSESSAEVSFKTVCFYDEWQVFDMVAASPLSLKHGGDKPGAPDVVLLRLMGEPKTVLRFAAEQAFGKVTDHWLGLLLAELNIGADNEAQQRYCTLLSKIDKLVRHLIPGISDEAVASILAKRAKAKEAACVDASYLTKQGDKGAQAMAVLCDSSGQNLWQGEAEDPEWDHAIVEKLLAYFLLKKYNVPKEMMVVERKVKKKSSAKQAVASASRESVRLTRQNVKRYLPKREDGDVILQAYPDAQRFQVYYPTAQPPRSHTTRYGNNGLTVQQALAAALAWAWGHHTSIAGEACPWEFVVM